VTIPRRQCTATSTRSGQRCRKAPIKGGTVCLTHGGATRMVASRAAVRAEVLAWGLDQPSVDPGETLLALVSMAAGRLRLVSSLLQAQYEGQQGAPDDADDDGMVSIPAGVRALIGHKYALTRDGDRLPVEEAVRGLAAYEAEWTDRLARLCKTAIDGVLQRVLDALELTPEQRRMVAVVAPRELRAVAG
jgi:hypothetical protein